MTARPSPRIVFAGTPEFALATLEALVDSGRRPVAVLTQPDRRAGRGRKLVASPVKRYALDVGIEVSQPRSLKDPEAQSALAALLPEILIVAAYGLLLPEAVLALPRHGCLNVHASLLPRWRGAAPIQAAILAGDRETGISLMRMDAGLDTGPVYVQSATPIGARTTAGELHDTLAALGASLVCEHLDAIVDGSLAASAQDDAGATYAGKIKTEDASIDWRRPADELDRLVRAYNPVPGARFSVAGEWVKCWQARPLAEAAGPAGSVAAVGRDGIDVACGQGTLRLERVQRAGRGVVSGRELGEQLALRGVRLD